MVPANKVEDFYQHVLMAFTAKNKRMFRGRLVTPRNRSGDTIEWLASCELEKVDMAEMSKKLRELELATVSSLMDGFPASLALELLQQTKNSSWITVGYPFKLSRRCVISS